MNGPTRIMLASATLVGARDNLTARVVCRDGTIIRAHGLGPEAEARKKLRWLGGKVAVRIELPKPKPGEAS